MAEQYEDIEFIDNEQPGTDAPIAIEDFEGGSDTAGTDSTATTEATSGVGEPSHFTNVKIEESSGTSDAESGDVIEASPSPSTSETSLTETEPRRDIIRAHNAAKLARDAATGTWAVVRQIEHATRDTENREKSICYKLECILKWGHRDNYRRLQDNYRSSARRTELVGREVTDAHYEAEQAADAADRAKTELSNATDPDEFETIRNRVLPVIDNAEEIGIRAFEKEYKGLKALKKYMTEVSTPADWRNVDTLYRRYTMDKWVVVAFIFGLFMIVGAKEFNIFGKNASEAFYVGIACVLPIIFVSIFRLLRSCTKRKVREIRDDMRKEIAQIDDRLHELRLAYGTDQDNEISSQSSNEET